MKMSDSTVLIVLYVSTIAMFLLIVGAITVDAVFGNKRSSDCVDVCGVGNVRKCGHEIECVVPCKTDE